VNESKSLNARLATIAFLLGAVLIFGGLGSLPLMVPDEGRNAEVAREMKLSGNWLIPTYNGLPYLDKPAFYFKTVALSLSLLGDTETAARLSSALSGFLLLLITFLFVRREYGARTGALAVMVVATCPLFLAFSRLVIFDMMLSLFVCGTIFAGYIAEQKKSRGWYALAAASSAMGTLIKGPVGFILPGLVLGIYHTADRRWSAFQRILAPLNLLVFFALTLPWFLGVNHYYPDFAYYGLVKESLERYTTDEFRRTAPFYNMALWVLIGLFTWTLLLPESIVAAWRNRRQLRNADRLFIIWAVVVVIFFSFSQSKRPGYILTTLVALGALIARALSNEKIVRRATVALAVVCLAGAIGLRVTSSRGGTILKVPAEDRAEVTAAFTQLAVALLCGAVVVAAVWRRRNVPACIALFVGIPAMVFVVGFGGLKLYAATKSARALSERLPDLPPGTLFAGLQCFPTGLPFYRKQFVNVFSKDGDEFTSNYITFMLKKTNPWPPGVTKLADRDAWLAARKQPVFVLARGRDRNELQAIVAEQGGTVTNFATGWWGALLPAPGGP
jgi:4-amino-4-deoxy-L-arabinose transferase-like glycosyltransferase